MQCFRQEYWMGMPCLPPGDLPDPGIESVCLVLLNWQADSLLVVPPGKQIVQTSSYKIKDILGV